LTFIGILIEVSLWCYIGYFFGQDPGDIANIIKTILLIFGVITAGIVITLVKFRASGQEA
ncbi:hypothetical protein BVX95_00340, partial [archaeon D22]